MPQQILSQTQQQRLQMVLAPQLRQSLHLLQVPVLELQSLIQQELQANPTLEEQLRADTPIETSSPDSEQEDPRELEFKEQYEILAKLDDEWKDYFSQTQTVSRYSSDEEAKRQFFLNSISQPESLQEHLMNQLPLAGLSEMDRKVGELVVGSINDDGYFTSSVEELASSTGYDMDHIQYILGVIQGFDPVGVGARDLSECLLLQLERLGKDDPRVIELVSEHLDKLGARKYNDIARAMKITVEEVQQLAHFVATLEPRPGRTFSSETPAYVLPEVLVSKVNGEYVIMLNNDYIPHLRISRHYRQLMENPETKAEVKNYIKEKIQAGAFLIKSIDQRQRTIYQIAKEIVGVQEGFLDHGVTDLKPLTMAEVAAKLGIHETTVSRAIANKYMQTPRGTFEIKYFFTPGYKRSDGTEVSNKTIKDAIAHLVANEDPTHPLSDQAIARELKEQGLTVARRTIAKYRDSLNILPSHLRKSY